MCVCSFLLIGKAPAAPDPLDMVPRSVSDSVKNASRYAPRMPWNSYHEVEPEVVDLDSIAAIHSRRTKPEPVSQREQLDATSQKGYGT